MEIFLTKHGALEEWDLLRQAGLYLAHAYPGSPVFINGDDHGASIYSERRGAKSFPDFEQDLLPDAPPRFWTPWMHLPEPWVQDPAMRAWLAGLPAFRSEPDPEGGWVFEAVPNLGLRADARLEHALDNAPDGVARTFFLPMWEGDTARTSNYFDADNPDKRLTWAEWRKLLPKGAKKS